MTSSDSPQNKILEWIIGAGGSLGFADPEARVGFGYVMNRTGHEILADTRSATLVEALYESL